MRSVIAWLLGIWAASEVAGLEEEDIGESGSSCKHLLSHSSVWRKTKFPSHVSRLRLDFPVRPFMPPEPPIIERENFHHRGLIERENFIIFLPFCRQEPVSCPDMDDPIEFEPFFRRDDSPNFWDNQTSKPFVSSLTKHEAFSGAAAKLAQPSWFDVRVFYVRASSCISDEAPDSLLIAYPPRNTGAELEVNGGRICPSERACFPLRRDRVDAGAAEATYVSTNNLRTSGDLPFEIYDKDDLIICGTLRRMASSTSEYESPNNGFISAALTACHSNEPGWSMECGCGIMSHSCFFLKGRMDFSAVNPTMEVYVAGQSCGTPLALTTTVKLSVRKKNLRESSLDVIPEVEEVQPNQMLARQIDEDTMYTKMADHPLAMGSFYMPMGGAYIGESEEGELSWFNAGVRVGVGIGLGICLGVGIGVGLLARPFKRRML